MVDRYSTQNCMHSSAYAHKPQVVDGLLHRKQLHKGKKGRFHEYWFMLTGMGRI